MAEKVEKFKLEVDVNAAEKSLDEAIKKLADLQKAQKDLQSTQKELGERTADNAKEYDALTKSLLKNKAEQTQVRKGQADAVKTIQAANNENLKLGKSLNDQRAQLGELKKEWANIDRTTADGQKRFALLTKEIDKLNNEIKEAEQATGDFRRNVGNYASALKDATGITGAFGGQLRNVVATTQGMTTATGGLIKGLGGLRGALIATGVGAFAVIIGSLISYFTQWQEGIDKVNVLFAQTRVIMAVVTDRIAQLGKGIALFLSGKFSEGVNEMGKAFEDLGTREMEAAKAAGVLEKANQSLRDKEIALLEVQSKRRIELAELREAAVDMTKTDSEREKALREAIKVQGQITQSEIEIEKERMRIMQEKANLASNTAEDERALAEQRAKILNLEAAEISERRKMFTQLTTMEKARNEAAKKAAAEEIARIEKLKEERRKADEEEIKRQIELSNRVDKAEQDLQISRLERNIQLAESNEERINREIELIQFRTAVALENENLLEAERQRIVEEEAFAIDKLNAKRIESAEKEVEINQSRKNDYMGVASAIAQSFNAAATGNQEAAKAAGIAEATVNYGRELSAIWAASAANPANAATAGAVGLAQGAAQSGLASARYALNLATISAAAGGGSFVTSKPTMLLVGDNPNGRERIDVTPLGNRGKTRINKNSGLVAMAGGGSLTRIGGQTAVSSSSQDAIMRANSSSVRDMLMNMPTPIVRVTDVNRVQKSVKVSERVGRF